MDTPIKKLEEVWTADGQKLGLAVHLYHRLEEIDPAVELYERYLEVCNLEIGDNYFVPMEFLRRDGEGGRLVTAVNLQEVLERTWTRQPDFVFSGAGRREELA
jgi:hypothetical protein